MITATHRALMRPLEGRVAVVAGGSRGIGQGIALKLARDGADCVTPYRKDHAAAAETVSALETLGGRAHERLDLAEPEQVGPIVERIAFAFGRVDVLVANAAATVFRPALEQKPHDVRCTFAISVHSLVAMGQAVVPLLKGRPGRIVLSGVDSFQAMGGIACSGRPRRRRRAWSAGSRSSLARAGSPSTR